MKPRRDFDFEKLLEAPPRPEPPSDLLARIKQQIPEDFAAQSAAEIEPDERRPLRPPRWLAAAVLLTAIGGSLLTLQLWRQPELEPGRSTPEAGLAAASEPSDPSAPEPPPITPSPSLETAKTTASAPGAAAPAQAVPDAAVAGAPSPDVPAPDVPAPDISSPDVEVADMAPRTVEPRPGARSSEVTERVADPVAVAQTAEPGVHPRSIEPHTVAAEASEIEMEVDPLVVEEQAREKRASEKSAAASAGRESISGDPRPVGESSAIARRPEPLGGEAEAGRLPPRSLRARRPASEEAGRLVSVVTPVADTDAYRRVERQIRDGRLPPAAAIRIEAFINAFDDRDRSPPSGAALRVEGAPVRQADGGYLLRVRGYASAPLGGPESVRLEVEFSGERVSAFRRVGEREQDRPPAAATGLETRAPEIEASRPPGALRSFTVLYELDLLDPPRAGDEVAVVRLRENPVDHDPIARVEHRVTGRDFAVSWEAASPELRFTSLVAEFAAILKSRSAPSSRIALQSFDPAAASPFDEVLHRVQQLAAERADDPRIAELATLIRRAASLRQPQG